MTVIEYFELCRNYWMVAGWSYDDANYKALWWDCKEIWDMDNSWTDEKRQFFNKMKERIPERKENALFV